MANLEQAVQNMINMCKDNRHGYDQTNRWGPDYDCSSAVITALRNAGFDTGQATYTGNMSVNLCARGFRRLSPAIPKRRGDILLNDVNHVALHLGNNQLAEYASNEYGGIIGGQSGDQTGGEARVRSYYSYPWNCVLRYTDAQSGGGTSPAAGQIDVWYAVMLKGGMVLPFIKNREKDASGDDFAGINGKEIVGIAVKVSVGSIEYEVHTPATGWLGKVTGCNFNNFKNGYAGDGSNAIDMIRMYLYSPLGNKYIYYRVSPITGNYYPYQRDIDIGRGMDGYAGIKGRSIDRIQMYVE